MLKFFLLFPSSGLGWKDQLDKCAQQFFECRPTIFLLQPVDQCMPCKNDPNCRSCLSEMKACSADVEVAMLKSGTASQEDSKYVDSFYNTVHNCTEMRPDKPRRMKAPAKVPNYDYKTVFATLLPAVENVPQGIEGERIKRHLSLMKQSAEWAFEEDITGRKLQDCSMFDDPLCNDPYIDPYMCPYYDDCLNGGRRRLQDKLRLATAEYRR